MTTFFGQLRPARTPPFAGAERNLDVGALHESIAEGILDPGSGRDLIPGNPVKAGEVGKELRAARGTDRILGAHLFCHNAEEMINIFAIAVTFGLTGRDLRDVLWAYPTSISDIKYMIT